MTKMQQEKDLTRFRDFPQKVGGILQSINNISSIYNFTQNLKIVFSTYVKHGLYLLISEWLCGSNKVSQMHEKFCHDPEIISLNTGYRSVVLGWAVLSKSDFNQNIPYIPELGPWCSLI